MGVKLMVEVLDHAPRDWTQSERLIVLAIAEQANDRTRRGYPGIGLIAHRAGVDADSVSRTLRRLAGKGTELRVPTGTDKTGRTVYAHRSHRTVYEIPTLCPTGDHQTSSCLESPDDGPAISDERADGGPPPEPERADGGPERPDQGPQRADGGPARPLNTLTSPQGGAGGDEAPPPPPYSGRASQPSLIPLPSVKLPEAVDLVYRWGLWNGYEDTTPDEARAVLQAFRRRYGSKPVGYVRSVAGPDGGGFDDLYREVRERRAAEVEAQIEAMQEAEPECEHGTRAGRAAHPVTGSLLCPLCRTGTPAPGAGPATPKPVAAAVDAYRAAYNASQATALRSMLLVDITQQATALLARGANAQQLTDLARRAGARGEGLVDAATRREPM